jgi:tetratricopeptide (TPR) repeat protein
LLSLDQIAENFRIELDKEPDSKHKIKLVIEFTNNYFDTIGHRGIPFLNDALAISKKINHFGGEVLCYCNLLFARFVSNDVSSKEIGQEMNRIYSLLPQIKEQPYEYSYALNLLGYLHWFRGEFDKGFDSAFESLKLMSQLKGHKEAGWIYYALGVFYFDTKDFSNSEKNYEEALIVFSDLNYNYGIARSKNGIASVKIKQDKNIDAIPFLEDAIETYRSGNFYSGLARALNDLALIQKSEKNYQKTIQLFNESLEIRREINHTQGLITSYTELGEIYLLLDDYTNALINLKEGLKLSDSIGAKYKSIRLHKLLSDSYKKTNDLKLAFEHFEKFHNMKSGVLSEESANNIRKMQTKFETEKSEKEAEIERLKNVELKSAYDLISEQKLILEEKQKEILDSIRYAKRIQSSLLPTEKYIEKSLTRLKRNTKI